jgi:Na+/H+-translocating membrane pyrophosphatase
MNFIVPAYFSFGTEDFPLMFHPESNHIKFMGCGVLGQLTNMTLLIMIEYLTSHGFNPVRNLTRCADNAPTLNVIQAYTLAYISQFFVVLTFGMLLLISYSLAGLIGILGAFTGFMMTIMVSYHCYRRYWYRSSSSQGPPMKVHGVPSSPKWLSRSVIDCIR